MPGKNHPLRFWQRQAGAYFIVPLLAGLVIIQPVTGSATVVTVTVDNQAAASLSKAPVTFGQVFVPGDVPAGASLMGRVGQTVIPLQVDAKASHGDGSLRHAILTAELPSLAAGESTVVSLDRGGPGSTGPAVALDALLATSFDATVTLTLGNSVFRASAVQLLNGLDVSTWLQGPLVTEWMVAGPLLTSEGVAHPQLSARFNVRAYSGLDQVRVSVTVENSWSREPGPRNYVYQATVEVDGKGVVLSQSNVNHYRQARWRRVFWWPQVSSLHVRHNAPYQMRSGAVPTYDATVPSSSLAALAAEWSGSATELMASGLIEPYMPGPGGRRDIAPLPRWAVRYLLTQDSRAKTAMLGTDEQAGSFGIHYRDRETDLPISLDTYPNMTVLGGTSFFPACGGDCSTPLEPDMAHQPSLGYLPYLVTGDYFYLEELQFWANWNMLHGAADKRQGARGLVAWDQIRGQAWGLRSLGHAAFATPDDHPLKSYFLAKLNSNIEFYQVTWLDSNPLGYMIRGYISSSDDWMAEELWRSTWMDDFLTWSFGNLVALGFGNARPMLEWKVRFPVGRMTHPDMCWILASTNWPMIMDGQYLGGAGVPIDTWDEWRRGIILSWDDDAFRPPGVFTLSGNEQALIDAECNSTEMSGLLGNWGIGNMIGYDGPEGYPANLQPALAVGVDAGIANAQLAWDRLTGANNYPEFNQGDPQWAVVPRRWPGPMPAPRNLDVK